MYGGHITDFFDRRANNTYLSVIFNEKLLQKAELAPKLTSPDPRIFDYDAYEQLIAKSLPPESPVIYGLHPNAEIGFLTNKAENLFQTILRLEVGAAADTAGGAVAGASAGSSSILRDTLTDLTKRSPVQFDLLELSEQLSQRVTEADGPYAVVVMQECVRMNTLIAEIAFSLDELHKGLNGQLNMSQGMEDMAECLELNQVPGRNPFHSCSWERLAWPSRKTLSSWFADLLLRMAQLQEWSRTFVLPYSVWLPGLVNPTALLTAIKQVRYTYRMTHRSHSYISSLIKA
jgi:dynein heavy chain